MKKLLLALFALSLLTACSSEAPKNAENAKPAPKPPELLTARSALQKLYISAHGWGPDARPYRVESTTNADSNGRDGKSAIWHAGFASVAQRGTKPYTWSGSEGPDRGVNPGIEDTYNPSNASTTARTSPVEGWTATSAASSLTSDSAFSAAVWTGSESVVRTVCGAVPGTFLSVRTGAPGLPQNVRHGILCHVAIEQRRAQRAVGIGADQGRQGNFVGAPHRNDRDKADQPGGIAPCAKCGGADTAPRGSVHRQLPFGQIIAVRLDGAPGKRAPWGYWNGGERRQRIAGCRRACVRIRARCTADNRCIGDLDHFPKSRSRFLCQRHPEGADRLSRSPGNAIGKRWRIPLRRSSDLSGRVNGSFSLSGRQRPSRHLGGGIRQELGLEIPDRVRPPVSGPLFTSQ